MLRLRLGQVRGEREKAVTTDRLVVGCGNPEHPRRRLCLPTRADTFIHWLRGYRCDAIVNDASDPEKRRACGNAIMVLGVSEAATETAKATADPSNG